METFSLYYEYDYEYNIWFQVLTKTLRRDLFLRSFVLLFVGNKLDEVVSVNWMIANPFHDSKKTKSPSKFRVLVFATMMF